MSHELGSVFGAMTIVGCAYWLVAAWLFARSARKQVETVSTTIKVPITILKPLHGAEPELAQNLLSFVTQDYPGPVKIIFGVQRLSDPAVGIVEEIRARSGRDISLVVGSREHGSNPKVSNLINMMSVVGDGIIVLADSDIRIRRNDLSRIAEILHRPGVGAVTCAYHGSATGGIWSRLSAAAIDSHFLPNVVFGSTLKLARPCFGAMIAMRRDVLERIGGFDAFANELADDYALGRAVRQLGLEVHIAPFLVTHMCSEPTFRDLIAHELRWAKTVGSINRLGFAGTGITHVIPFSILSLVFGGAFGNESLLVGVSLICRFLSVKAVVRRFKLSAVPLWLIPMRDLLSFYVYLASYFPGGVSWKDRAFLVGVDGTMVARRESE